MLVRHPLPCLQTGVAKRDRGRQREEGREIEGEKQRKRDRQRQRNRDREGGRETESQRKAERWRERDGEGETGRGRQKQRERDRDRDRTVGRLLPEAGGRLAALVQEEGTVPTALGRGALSLVHKKPPGLPGLQRAKGGAPLARFLE